jgi:hypothetical protein
MPVVTPDVAFILAGERETIVAGVWFHRAQRHAAGFSRLAIFAMVARLQPVAACIDVRDWRAAMIMLPIAALRSTSSARPL